MNTNTVITLRKTRGFTLVEIMIVVTIIALLASIAVPNFLRARKRSQATRILQDLRMLDGACDMYAMETNKISGMNPNFADLKNYLKTGTTLYSTGKDIFGVPYANFTVDSIPKVSTSSFNALSDVADASFWSPYK
jgi:prepilin-type N-terminal cleavage/methylation domain-containing protein